MAQVCHTLLTVNVFLSLLMLVNVDGGLAQIGDKEQQPRGVSNFPECLAGQLQGGKSCLGSRFQSVSVHH